MKRVGQILLFLCTCAACAAAGRLLARSGGAGSRFHYPADEAAAVSSSDRKAGSGSKNADLTALPETRAILLRRLLKNTSTVQIWSWLGGTEKLTPELAAALSAELVDRQGWQAWELALQFEDPKQKEVITGLVLSQLSIRDPWKAYEAWKQTRGQFEPDWAWDVNSRALRAAAQSSAASVVDLLRTAEVPQQNLGGQWSFGPGFDFRTVVDYFNQTAKPSVEMPYNLVNDWAAAAPLEAAQWLLQHPEFVAKGDQLDISPRWMVKGIANLPEGTPGRAEALETLSHMPPDFISSAWETRPQDTQGGKFSPAMREAAISMGQEDAYLPATLAQTQWQDTLDPSWQQVPVDERATLLEKAEKTMPPEDKLSPLEKRARERWLQMVREGWGLNG